MSRPPSLAAERTSLAFRRTLLGLVLNVALLVRMPPLGLATGALVLAGTTAGYLAMRRTAKPALCVLLVLGTGCLDAATMLVAHR